MIKLKLIYPNIRSGLPPHGIAIANNVRETPTQYVIDPKCVEIISGRVRFYGERRYYKKNGHEVGAHIRTWYVSETIEENNNG